MSEILHQFINITAKAIEVLGVIIIIVGAIISLWRYIFRKQGENHRSFQIIREELGRAILLGLEFLVAADIIATVTYDSTMEQILKLGLIVLIRTFLSFTLEIEIEGKFPWKQDDTRTTGKK